MTRPSHTMRELHEESKKPHRQHITDIIAKIENACTRLKYSVALEDNMVYIAEVQGLAGQLEMIVGEELARRSGG